jgi:hypothetical protein
MKELSEILQQEPVFLNSWTESKRFGVIADFEDVYLSENEYYSEESYHWNNDYIMENKRAMKKALELHKDDKILFASYGYENYSGDAYVLFYKNDNLYEVFGSHCSCYGLEGQWKPDETSLAALEDRLIKGSFGEDNYSGNEFKAELKQFLGVK